MARDAPNGVAGEKFCTGDAGTVCQVSARAATALHPCAIRSIIGTHRPNRTYFGEPMNCSTNPPPRASGTKLMSNHVSGAGPRRVSEKFPTSAPSCSRWMIRRMICAITNPVMSSCVTKVYPAFRPDKALTVNLPESFNAWWTSWKSPAMGYHQPQQLPQGPARPAHVLPRPRLPALGSRPESFLRGILLG